MATHNKEHKTIKLVKKSHFKITETTKAVTTKSGEGEMYNFQSCHWCNTRNVQFSTQNFKACKK